MTESQALAALHALAQPMRLRVFRALVVQGPSGLTPGVLTQTLTVPASTLSFHLKELLAAGLITQERDGRLLIYRAALAHMGDLLAYLGDQCCQGQGCPEVPAGGCSRTG